MLALLGGMFWSDAAQAQVAWESPMMAAPNAPAGLGVYVGDVAGGNIGLIGTYRGASAPTGLEFRFGIAESGASGGDVSGLFGVTIGGNVARASRDMPFTINWVAGAGLGIGDWALITIPLGLTLGHTFTGDGINITPYVTPRIHLDAAVGNDVGDDTDLGLAVDLGFDLRVRRGWVLRFGAALGDHEAFALGIVF